MQHASDLIDGVKQGAVIGLAALLLTLPAATAWSPRPAASSATAATGPTAGWSAAAAPAPAAVAYRAARFDGAVASDDARLVADWIATSRDNRNLPFAILDKREATVFIFDRNAELIGASPVLLGAAPGDESVEGIGDRPIAAVAPHERTTPAGRFVSRPGKNASGEDVVWVDYAAAVSMHRVRPIDPKERRLERLASPDAAMRRISYGCINVPVAFFERVVSPVLGKGRAVVYVLPETKTVRDVFWRAPNPVPKAMLQPSMVRSTPHDPQRTPTV